MSKETIRFKKKFFRSFASKKYGEILILRQESDEGNPEVRVFFWPDDAGVSSYALEFKEGVEYQFNEDKVEDSPEHLADLYFDKISLETIEGLLEALTKEMEFTWHEWGAEVIENKG